jgi:hypothetical protein
LQVDRHNAVNPRDKKVPQVVHRGFKSTMSQSRRQSDELSRFRERVMPMKKTFMALAAAATLAVSSLAATAPASAQHWHGGPGPGLAAGLLGGAIIGGAIANSGGYYGPGYAYGPGYGYGPAYVAAPGYYGGCYWQRQRFWDGYGWRMRRVRVCG